MNLTNNVIQPDEIRSASLVSIKTLAKVTALIIPVILALFLVRAYLIYVEQRSTLHLLESTWSATDVKKKRVTELATTFKATSTSLAEVEGWQRSRVAWHEVLEGLQQQMLPAIQLKTLQARQSLNTGSDGKIERQIKVTLNGRCQGPDADARVQATRGGLSRNSLLGPQIKSVEVTGFREDTEPGAGELDRAFQIDIVFNPRSFREIAAKQ